MTWQDRITIASGVSSGWPCVKVTRISRVITFFFLTATAAIAQVSVTDAQDTRVAEFTELALGLEHLTGMQFAQDCDALERATAKLSTKELLKLFDHPQSYVRAAAIVGSYVDDRVQALPQVFASIDDDAPAQPYRQVCHVAILFNADGTYRESGPPYENQPQTVGAVARAIIRAHIGTASGRFSYPLADHRRPAATNSPGFEEYWLERKDRQDCLSWLKLALGRAVRGSTARPPIALERVAALRQRIDSIEQPYGGWVLLALGTPWDQGRHLEGGDLLADEQDLIQAGRTIGAPALMRFLAGEAPDVSDPDCALGKDSRFPYERVAAFILRHAPELLPSTSVDTLLEFERRHLANEPVGDAPGFPSSVWSIAAADLMPDDATAILREGFTRHTARRTAHEQDQRVFLAIALWRRGGEGQLDFILDWFFDEVPAGSAKGFGRHRLSSACADKDFRPVLRAIIADNRMTSLDAWTFADLAHATSRAVGRDVVPSQDPRRLGATREHVLLLREAW